MQYQEFRPIAALRPYVNCIWTLEDRVPIGQYAPKVERILPDGQMEVIFHLGSRFLHKDKDTERVQARSFLYGQLHQYVDLIPSANAKIIAIRFRPYGLFPFVSLSPKEFQAQQIGLQDLFGNSGRELEEQVNEATDTSSAVSIIEAFLLRQLINFSAPDPLIVHVSEVITQSGGLGDIKDIIRSYKISPRHFQRKFLEVTGTKSKTLARITRLQKAIRLAQHQSFSTLTELSLAAGYYDQAHFIRDFKSFAGQTPRRFFQQQHELNEQFIGS